ncbi:MAG: hypothetical protein L0322_26860, partial [Chloroflexi bacterium]|nr:hypothetical protein [Chloroflexota bacterium]
MRLTGKATREGTAAYAQAHSQLTYTPLDGPGWLISQAGFGGYRVDAGLETHRRAIRQALGEAAQIDRRLLAEQRVAFEHAPPRLEARGLVALHGAALEQVVA